MPTKKKTRRRAAPKRRKTAPRKARGQIPLTVLKRRLRALKKIVDERSGGGQMSLLD